MLLEAFRLPGEAQQIARVVEHFSNDYFLATRMYLQGTD